MFWIELIIVLAIIFIGVRVGGTFLAMAGGIGMFIMTFILHVTPSDPPITVILIMIAVICAAATMQACGGLDYLVRIAEKILRKNPKMITVLAPVVAYIFTFMCGTGHIVYSLLPVINEIAIETGVRPERPISASIVSSQQAITACPISAAKVNADAVVQTNNSAHLEYGNDPDNITTTTPDVVTTPTYPVQIHKLIKDQQNSYLAGAIFRLYRSEEDANNNQNAIAVTGSNGTYTVDPEQVGDNKMYDMESIGDGTTVGTGMNLKLNGLAEGSYWLVETQAPDGYNKLTAPVKITITKSDTTNVNDWTIKQNDGVVDDKIIDIENTTGTLLPETGGMGTVIFTVIAVVMILGIAVSFVISRRKRA